MTRLSLWIIPLTMGLAVAYRDIVSQWHHGPELTATLQGRIIGDGTSSHSPPPISVRSPREERLATRSLRPRQPMDLPREQPARPNSIRTSSEDHFIMPSTRSYGHYPNTDSETEGQSPRHPSHPAYQKDLAAKVNKLKLNPPQGQSTISGLSLPPSPSSSRRSSPNRTPTSRHSDGYRFSSSDEDHIQSYTRYPHSDSDDGTYHPPRKATSRRSGSRRTSLTQPRPSSNPINRLNPGASGALASALYRTTAVPPTARSNPPRAASVNVPPRRSPLPSAPRNTDLSRSRSTPHARPGGPQTSAAASTSASTSTTSNPTQGRVRSRRM